MYTKLSFRMGIAAVLLAAFVAIAGGAVPAKVIELDACLVQLEDEAKLSAEEAGVLLHLAVKQGRSVEAGTVLAQIDARQPALQRAAAKAEWDAAEERHKSTIEVEYAQASADVAKKTYEKMLLANKGTPNAVTQIEVDRAGLEWNTAKLQIKKALHDQYLATFDVGSKQAQHELAQLGIDRRTIKAPFDGVVVDLYRHQSEWVNPGDPILHLVRLNTLRVERYVEQKQYDPSELDGCEVTVDVKLARDRVESLPGRITFVSPLLDLNGRYLVRAEVANRRDPGGHWILRPNHKPMMKIHLGTGTAGAIEIGRRNP
ncbi:MAG: HlyD family efflux transporter periplasmic adaptor subunit [Pirellulales bacterium]